MACRESVARVEDGGVLGHLLGQREREVGWLVLGEILQPVRRGRSRERGDVNNEPVLTASARSSAGEGTNQARVQCA